MPRLRRLRDAFEVQHYAALHAQRRFVVVLDETLQPGDVLLDLHLATAHGLTLTLLAAPGPGPLPHPVVEVQPGDDAAIARAIAGHQVALIRQAGLRARMQTATTWAERLGADRLVVVSADLTAHLNARGHLSLPEARPRMTGLPYAAILLAHAARPGRSVVVLDGAPGCLFEELFTHHGAGTLIGDSLIEQVRHGVPADAAEIFLLLRADIERGVIRPVDEFEVARTVNEHLVYTIDGVVVATARLAPWGRWAELSRFATRPRYRGRGRARTLGRALVDYASAEHYEAVFSLSVDARMWRFFEGLGLEPIARTGLPEAWQRGYDFERPSRAFMRRLRASSAP
jgi:N-acetylglutamate synthase-like GNAT family acetyltransferase